MRALNLAATSAAIAVVAAACSSSGPNNTPSTTQAQSQSGSALGVSTPSANGPFTVHLDYCGKFSAAQQQAYDTQATSGVLYTVTNTSQGVTGTPVIEANLTNGSQVVGSAKTTFAARPIAPGQNEKIAAEPMDGEAPFTGCQTLNYYVNDTSGTTEGPFTVQ